ncbi:MAG: 4-phosphopantoate--beta-alanine ligase [Candidatus Altiarchaeota archaeon]|nr:4-phosphopantoate--beta-alanine ligase [Candidatus Altiarchaeota archaeon]
MDTPQNHPRIKSLKERSLLVQGLREGIIAEAGLIAHGRGEAFDYLLGEKTTPEALKAVKAATAMLLLAENPVISVNGNSAALSAKEIVELSNALDAKIEINLFHKSRDREEKIQQKLLQQGAEKVYGMGEDASERIPELKSNRGKVDPQGIHASDVVLVALEDGDRTETLIAAGKKVIAVDLNPLSRTAQKATVTIVNNLTRALPKLTETATEYREIEQEKLKEITNEFNNKKNLEETIEKLRAGI